MRRPPFLEQSEFALPAGGRRAANAARRREMRWNRDVGLTMRHEARLTRRSDEAWLASFPPEARAEAARSLSWFAEDAEAGDAMRDR
jgi:hypothetical protein